MGVLLSILNLVMKGMPCCNWQKNGLFLCSRSLLRLIVNLFLIYRQMIFQPFTCDVLSSLEGLCQGNNVYRILLS